MNVRTGSGWQTVLADLSMILFMVTASAVGEAPAQPPTGAVPALPALGEPVALWREGPGAPGLSDWLASANADPRLRLTILAEPARVDAALALARSAGRPARIVIEANNQGITAALTYDQGGLAQGLQQDRAKENAR